MQECLQIFLMTRFADTLCMRHTIHCGNIVTCDNRDKSLSIGVDAALGEVILRQI